MRREQVEIDHVVLEKVGGDGVQVAVLELDVLRLEEVEVLLGLLVQAVGLSRAAGVCYIRSV